MSTVIKVRRPFGDSWRISDRDNFDFIESFEKGLLTDVTFVGDAPAMYCHEGVHGTGEAQGKNLERGVTKMPECKISYQLWFDRDAKVFHKKDSPHVRPEGCDFLLLLADGSAFAGWKEI